MMLIAIQNGVMESWNVLRKKEGLMFPQTDFIHPQRPLPLVINPIINHRGYHDKLNQKLVRNSGLSLNLYGFTTFK